jgi:protein gp37
MSVSKIEWVRNPDGVTHGWSWSPVVGCRHGCSYCAAREIARRFPAVSRTILSEHGFRQDYCIQCQTFEPHTHWERELPKFRKPTTVFIGFMCDLWGDWVPEEWIQDVLDKVWVRTTDIFITLTKNPYPYRYRTFPANLWYGATIDTEEQSVNILDAMCTNKSKQRFVSFEPLLQDIPLRGRFEQELFAHLSCVIVGPLNHRGPAVTRREWVEHIIEAAEAARVPVFMKNACLKPRAFVDGKCFTEPEMRRELPWVKG